MMQQIGVNGRLHFLEDCILLADQIYPEKYSSCSSICERQISVDVPSIAPTAHSSLVHGHRSSLYSFIVGHCIKRYNNRCKWTTTFPGRLHTFGRSDLSKSTTNSYTIYNTTNKPFQGLFNIYQIDGPVHFFYLLQNIYLPSN
jgi:hypothetical protein